MATPQLKRSIQVDEAISLYIQSRRSEVPLFVAKNFELRNYLQKSKKELLTEFLIHIANSFWVLPYATLKKVADELDKLGWDKALKIVKQLPPGWPSPNQRKFEERILSDLFGISRARGEGDLFFDYIKDVQGNDRFDAGDLRWKLQEQLRLSLSEWFQRKMLWNEINSSGVLWVLGLLIFNDNKLGVFGIANKIADWWSYNEASSKFILGKKTGRIFYNFFPTHPTLFQICFSFFATFLVLAILTFTLSLFVDPLQKKLGLHERNLQRLLDSLEDKLILATRKKS